MCSLLPCEAGCPAGKSKCGKSCIDPSSQCCKSNSTVGLACAAPETCLADGAKCGERMYYAASWCQQLGKPSMLLNSLWLPHAGCANAGHVKCGSLCIDSARECCRTNSTVGLTCSSPAVCLSDGASCSECGPSSSGATSCGIDVRAGLHQTDPALWGHALFLSHASNP